MTCRVNAKGGTVHHRETEVTETSFRKTLCPPWLCGARSGFPELVQVVPRVNPRGVPVGPVDSHGVIADLFHAAGLHVRLDLLVADDALAAPLLDTFRARAAGAQPARLEARVLSVIPAD